MQTARIGNMGRDRLMIDRIHDPYQARRKPAEPCVCRACGAVFEHGRWRWGLRPREARQDLCEACHRIRTGLQAGSVSLAGDFVRRRRAEMVCLIRHQEAQENREHPQHRIMSLEPTTAGLLVRTTDLHLPRRIGEALRRAYKGELDLHFETGSCSIRVSWRRES